MVCWITSSKSRFFHKPSFLRSLFNQPVGWNVMRFFNTHLADFFSLSEVPILIGSLKLFSTAIWVWFSGGPCNVRRLWDSTRIGTWIIKLCPGVSNQRIIQSLWLDFSLSNTCYFLAFWILKISCFSPTLIAHFDFCKLRCLHCLVLQDFLLAASTGCPGSSWVCFTKTGRETNSTLQGLMISCKSPSPNDNRWKLSPEPQKRQYQVEDQATEGLKPQSQVDSCDSFEKQCHSIFFFVFFGFLVRR